VDQVPYVRLEEENLVLKDGGNINFCWGPGNFGNDPDYPEKKILIILAGLNGSYKANYVL
jgi:predicted alpha/beta-fold hydrolase